jgi:hypothetical protein
MNDLMYYSMMAILKLDILIKFNNNFSAKTIYKIKILLTFPLLGF